MNSKSNISDNPNLLENSNVIRIDSIDSFKIINPNVDSIESTSPSDTINNLNESVEINVLQSINIHTHPNTIYLNVLEEIYEIISDNNELFGCKNLNVSKPDIKYENRKTFWFNFGKNCSQINRTVGQLQKYIDKELAVETSINDKSQLILRGKYNFNLIASTYKKYIKNYVQCSTCKSTQTEIIRNSSNRLDYLKCLNPKCNTCKVVSKIT
jgi:translation initiation factor 2 beta subunit (eIF-2beta)/eIF-5